MEACKIFSDRDKYEMLVWLKGLQNPDGGFSMDKKKSTISFSYYVFRTLLKLNSVDFIDTKGLVDFIISNKCPEKGFSDSPGEKPDPKYTSYALFMLKELDILDPKFFKENLQSFLQEDGSGIKKGENESYSNIRYVYYVLRCYSILESLNIVKKEKIAKLVRKIRDKYSKDIKYYCKSQLDNIEILKQIVYIIEYSGSIL